MPWNLVKGHDALRQSFANVVQQGRLAHAYLFTGPSGIGKKLFAIELAKTLLCERRKKEFAPCDACPSCKQIVARTHPDFVLAGRPEEAHELPIVVMREVCQQFAIKSARGRGKVAIIDDADDMNEESANCFLKTLEEPPPQSVIILLGSTPDRQLPTILSRCQTIRFAPLPSEMVEEILKSLDVDKKLLPQLVELGEGSPGQALLLSDPALWKFRQSWIHGLTTPKIQSVLLAKEWTRFVEDVGKESAAQRRRATQCLSLLLSFLRSVLRVNLGQSPTTEDKKEQQAIQAVAQRLTTEQTLDLIERCLQADAQIDRRVQLVLVLEALMDTIGQKWKTTSLG